MNPALFKLIGLQSRGFTRRMIRGARSPRRAVFLIIGFAVIVLWLGPSVAISIAQRHAHGLRLDPAPRHLRAIFPLVLLGICVLTIVSSAADKAIAFTPGEADMLFPGPFTRRQLLGYKIIKSALGALLTALILSLALLPQCPWWLACYVGAFLTLLFIQLFSTAGVLAGQTLGGRANTLFRRAVLFAAILLIVVAARHWLASRGGMEGVYQFRYSQLGRNVLAPFEPLARTMTAKTPGELAQAGGEAALIDLGLFFLVVLLDANYLEAAMGASQRRFQRLQRIRGGSVLSSKMSGSVRWTLPSLGWLGGAGPIIWRQATTAARSARGLLMLLGLLAVCIGPLFGSALRTTDVAQPLVAAIAWLTVLLSGLLKFDFRGDLDHIDELKALPLRPGAMAIGQLIVPTVILTVIHLTMLIGVGIAVGWRADLLIVAACLALPFNALLMASENLIFLLFPTRPAAASPGDFQMLGRQTAQLVMKALTVMLGLALALGIAFAVEIPFGGQRAVLTAVAGVLLIGETCCLIPAIAWAYNRFDPSVDTPA